METCREPSALETEKVPYPGRAPSVAVIEIVGAGVVPAANAQTVTRIERALHFGHQGQRQQLSPQQRRIERVHIAHGGDQPAVGQPTNISILLTSLRSPKTVM